MPAAAGAQAERLVCASQRTTKAARPGAGTTDQRRAAAAEQLLVHSQTDCEELGLQTGALGDESSSTKMQDHVLLLGDSGEAGPGERKFGVGTGQ